MRKLLLYGPGGLGQQTAYLLKTHFPDEFDVLGFVADRLERGTDVYRGLRVIGPFEEVLATTGLRPQEACMLVTVGYLHMDERKRAVAKAAGAGYEMPAIVSPLAVVEKNVAIGPGTIITAGAVVDNQSNLGDCVFINPGACIAHECDIGAGTILAPGATLGGCVKLGEYVFAGINCTVVNNVCVGDFAFINAASLVSKNVPGFTQYRERRTAQLRPRTGPGGKERQR